MPYVYVSGYVAILFGRSRTSEDIDILAHKIPFEEFTKLWTALKRKFYCHNTNCMKTAYYEYLGEKTALRFSWKDTMLPNVKFKWASNLQHLRTLDDSLKVRLAGERIVISSLEMQIAFKLFLGSDKDIEDARYLFVLFREKLDMARLKREIATLDIKLKSAQEKLGWTNGKERK